MLLFEADVGIILRILIGVKRSSLFANVQLIALEIEAK
jgi:hypothetical protein